MPRHLSFPVPTQNANPIIRQFYFFHFQIISLSNFQINTMAVKKTKPTEANLIISQIDTRPVLRITQDIENWRNALRTAESKFNPTRKLLYDLYADILLDGHLESVIAKRNNAITNTTLRFMKDGKDVDWVNEMINSESFDYVLEESNNAVQFGLTLFEFAFQNQKIIPYMIDRRHVKPELNGGIVTHTPYDMDGIRYNEGIYKNTTMFVGKPKDFGLLLKVAQYVIYKRGGIGDYAQCVEVFGQPFKVGTYDPFDENSRTALKTAFDSAGSSPYIIKPNGTTVELIPFSSAAGSAQLYALFLNFMNGEISKIEVGQTLTTEQGNKGTQALGIVHMQEQKEFEKSDIRNMSRVLNGRFIDILKIHFEGIDGGKFVFEQEEIISKKDMLDMDIKLSNKIPLGDDYFYETYNKPKPTNYNELKAEQKAAQQAKQLPPKVGAGQDLPAVKKAIKNLYNRFFA